MYLLRTNVVLAYILLVGIPIVALIGIVDAGSDLRAPTAIGGKWELSTDFRALALGSCSPSQAGEPIVLSISQSGRYFTLSFGHLQGSGILDQAAFLSDDLRPASDSSSCGAGAPTYYLRGRLERPDQDEEITGVAGIEGCAACRPISFRAIRRNLPAKATH